jgi:hypothetical protein
MLDRLAAANPLPEHSVDIDDSKLLLAITERSVDMSTNTENQATKGTPPGTNPQSPKRPAGWIVALAAFAVVVVFGALALLATSDTDAPPSAPPTTEAAPPTTEAAPPTTEAAPPTTEAPTTTTAQVVTDPTELVLTLEWDKYSNEVLRPNSAFMVSGGAGDAEVVCPGGSAQYVDEREVVVDPEMEDKVSNLRPFWLKIRDQIEYTCTDGSGTFVIAFEREVIVSNGPSGGNFKVAGQWEVASGTDAYLTLSGAGRLVKTCDAVFCTETLRGTIEN